MHKYVGGTFKSIKTQEAIDFYTKFGFKEEICKSLLGTHWTITNKLIDNKTIHMKITCQEFPSYLIDKRFHEGEECEFEDPFVGKCKGSFKAISENKFNNIIHYEGIGTLVMTDIYDENGITMTFECKEKGLKVTKLAERYVDMDGFYHFKSGKDYKGFPSLFEGIEFDMVEKSGFKFYIENQGDAVKSVDFIDGKEWAIITKFGEETCYPFEKNVAILSVLQAPGKVLSISKHKDGRVQEALMTYNGDEAVMDCKDHKTGKVCQVVFEKYHDFSGTFKFICNHGGYDYFKSTGGDLEKFKAMVNDPNTKLKLEHNGINFNRMLTSCGLSLKVAWKFGEEFDFAHPLIPGEKFKCLATIHNNKIIIVGKGKGMTFKSVLTMTKNFAFQEDELVGTGMKELAIWQRV